ncbi:MAG: hypothetical protein Q9191_002012 [Dirinaria sp. TL-2023a]
MSLARAFTKRHKRPDIAVMTPARAASVKNHNGPISRSLISPPVELISTTNVLAYNAPNIYGDDSDSSLGSLASSRGTTPDTSSIECSPSPVEENHLSSFFRTPGQPVSTSGSGSLRQSSASSDVDVHTIPVRNPSRTMKSTQDVARKQSLSKVVPAPLSLPSAKDSTNNIDPVLGKPDVRHPFGPELEQVNELAEEIRGHDVVILDEEEQYLASHGLCKFGAQDYLDEINGFCGGSYANPFSPLNAGWI